MKRPLALLAAFLVLFVLGATLGIAQANTPADTNGTLSTDTPTTTATATATVTTTATPTMTSTATTDPCDGAPPPPDLIAPANGATVNQAQVPLRWSAAPCAVVYRFVIRASSNSIIQRGRTRKLHATTQTLSRGATYYWTVKACNPGKGCNHSKQRHFHIQAPPTPIPPTPGPTGQPTTPPNGTPVPGTPPGNLLNTDACGTPPYPCRGVYLSDDSSARWYFNCSWKWVPYGGTVFVTSLWFYPNEGVSLRVDDFNKALTTETHHYTANSSGYLEVSLDTSGWVQDHYHLLFDGDKSGVEYCGHFDLALTAASPVEHPAHTQAEWDEFYRRLNSSPH